MDWLGWAGSGTWGVIERMGSFEPWSTSPMTVRQAGSLGCVGNTWDPRSDREDGFFEPWSTSPMKVCQCCTQSPSHRLSFTKIMTTTTMTTNNNNNSSHGISEFRKKDFLSKINAVFSTKKWIHHNWNKLIIISIAEYMSRQIEIQYMKKERQLQSNPNPRFNDKDWRDKQLKPISLLLNTTFVILNLLDFQKFLKSSTIFKLIQH